MGVLKQLLILLTILCFSGCKDGVSPSGNGHGEACGIGTQYPDDPPANCASVISFTGVRVCTENLNRNASDDVSNTPDCWCECGEL